MKQLCEEYRITIEKHRNRFTEPGMHNNFEIARGHVLYMLKQIPDLGDPGKQNRWIGFVQGWMWSVGLRNIDEMREDIRQVMNRSAEFVETPSPLTFTEAERAEMAEHARQCQAQRDRDWSILANQVVGAERI